MWGSPLRTSEPIPTLKQEPPGLAHPSHEFNKTSLDTPKEQSTERDTEEWKI